jgi:hypothetical protein
VHNHLYSHTLEIRQIAGTAKDVQFVFIRRIAIAAEQPLAADHVDGEKRVRAPKNLHFSLH